MLQEVTIFGWEGAVLCYQLMLADMAVTRLGRRRLLISPAHSDLWTCGQWGFHPAAVWCHESPEVIIQFGLSSQLWCCHKCDRLPKTSQPAMWLKHMIIVTRKTCTEAGVRRAPSTRGLGWMCSYFLLLWRSCLWWTIEGLFQTNKNASIQIKFAMLSAAAVLHTQSDLLLYISDAL